MKKNTKTEIFDWFEYSDDPHESLDRLKEFIKNYERKAILILNWKVRG